MKKMNDRISPFGALGCVCMAVCPICACDGERESPNLPPLFSVDARGTRTEMEAGSSNNNNAAAAKRDELAFYVRAHLCRCALSM